MEEVGRVIEINGDKAKIQIKRHASCSKCGACGMGKNAAIYLELINTLGAHTGQYVLIRLESSMVLQAALWLYGLPLCAFIGGYALGAGTARQWAYAPAETSGIIAGFLALAGAYATIRWVERRFIKPARYLPHMVEILSGVTSDVPGDNPLTPPLDTPH